MTTEQSKPEEHVLFTRWQYKVDESAIVNRTKQLHKNARRCKYEADNKTFEADHLLW